MNNYWINVINTAHMVTGFLSVIYGLLIAAIIITTVTTEIGSIEPRNYHIKYITYGLLFLLLLILMYIFTSPIN